MLDNRGIIMALHNQPKKQTECKSDNVRMLVSNVRNKWNTTQEC